MVGQKTFTGNQFTKKKENGKNVWYWFDSVGSQCGTDRKWRYIVQEGDSIREAGTCPDKTKWYEMKVFGAPKKI